MRPTVLLGCLLLGFSWLPGAGQWVQAESGGELQPNESGTYTVPPGTRILLELSTALNTQNAAEGDCVYLRTVHPVNAGGRIVIPVGSHVTGTITNIKRAGRLHLAGEFNIRFDSLLLPNGVSRDLRGTLLTVGGNASARVDRTEGKVKGQGRDVGDSAIQGAIGGAAWGGMFGAGIQRAAISSAIFGGGALRGGLLSRGPEAALQEGTKIVMVLDRPLQFEESDLEGIFTGPPGSSAPASPRRTRQNAPGPFPSPDPYRLPLIPILGPLR